jgi:hypothetical protein
MPARTRFLEGAKRGGPPLDRNRLVNSPEKLLSRTTIRAIAIEPRRALLAPRFSLLAPPKKRGLSPGGGLSDPNHSLQRAAVWNNGPNPIYARQPD